ncbi:hypothetical protein A4G99_22010 [Haladaptatus sp. R4]|nr:hypothetical protein A4G99_22010 [Haladaptatus sp. R4]
MLGVSVLSIDSFRYRRITSDDASTGNRGRSGISVARNRLEIGFGRAEIRHENTMMTNSGERYRASRREHHYTLMLVMPSASENPSNSAMRLVHTELGTDFAPSEFVGTCERTPNGTRAPNYRSRIPIRPVSTQSKRVTMYRFRRVLRTIETNDKRRRIRQTSTH